MKNITNKHILEYLKKLIILYNNESNSIEKVKIARDIYNYVICVDYLSAFSNDIDFIEFGDQFYEYYTKELQKHVKLYKAFSEEKTLEEYKNLEREADFNQDEISYLLYLMSKVNIQGKKNTKLNSNPLILINEYLNNDKDTFEYFKSLKDNLWYNKSFSNSTALKLEKNKDIIFLNNYNISVIFHEFMHLYSNELINTKYKETAPIIGEVAINSYYGIRNNLDVLENFEYTCLNNSTFYYIMAFLISIPFIYKNGNDFNIVKQATEILVSNNNIDFMNMLNKLNIKEKDIIDSFNKKR